MQDETKRTTNIAELTPEDVFAITYVLAERLCVSIKQLEQRKSKWEKDRGADWGTEYPRRHDLLDDMVDMQEERVNLCELALDAFGEKVMGFKRRISFPDSGSYVEREEKKERSENKGS